MTRCLIEEVGVQGAARLVEAGSAAAEAAMLAALRSIQASLPDLSPFLVDGLVSSALCEAYCRHFGPTLAGDHRSILSSANHVAQGLLMMADEFSPAREILNGRASS